MKSYFCFSFTTMYKSTLAIFFSILFVVLNFAPTMVTLLDTEYDISILLDASEEEEKEGKESTKDIEIKILHVFEYDANDFFTSSSSVLGFYSNSYSSTHTELSYPPPKTV